MKGRKISIISLGYEHTLFYDCKQQIKSQPKKTLKTKFKLKIVEIK